MLSVTDHSSTRFTYRSSPVLIGARWTGYFTSLTESGGVVGTTVAHSMCAPQSIRRLDVAGKLRHVQQSHVSYINIKLTF